MRSNYDIRMVKETECTIYVKEFNGHEVYSIQTNKKSCRVTERWEHLGKYATSAAGLKNQLLLKEYEEVRV